MSADTALWYAAFGIGVLALGGIVVWWRLRRQQWYRSWNAMLREREVKHRRELGVFDAHLTERRAKVHALQSKFNNSPRMRPPRDA